MIIRNMKNELFHENESGIKHIYTFMGLMVDIVPPDKVKVNIIVFNPTLSHDRTANITNNIIHTVLSGFVSRRWRVNIEAIGIISITLLFYDFKIWGIQFVFHAVKQLLLKRKPQRIVVDMV